MSRLSDYVYWSMTTTKFDVSDETENFLHNTISLFFRNYCYPVAEFKPNRKLRGQKSF